MAYSTIVLGGGSIDVAARGPTLSQRIPLAWSCNSACEAPIIRIGLICLFITDESSAKPDIAEPEDSSRNVPSALFARVLWAAESAHPQTLISRPLSPLHTSSAAMAAPRHRDAFVLCNKLVTHWQAQAFLCMCRRHIVSISNANVYYIVPVPLNFLYYTGNLNLNLLVS